VAIVVSTVHEISHEAGPSEFKAVRLLLPGARFAFFALTAILAGAALAFIT
jgi:hypothetical protein